MHSPDPKALIPLRATALAAACRPATAACLSDLKAESQYLGLPENPTVKVSVK